MKTGSVCRSTACINHDRGVIDDPVSALALVLAVGIGAQWLAGRIGLPAIVLMLGSGLMVGPVLGLLDPDEVFGPVLTPLIGVGVGVLLFEGGLTLRWDQIGNTTRKVVIRMLTIGVVVSFAGATTVTLLATDLPRGVAVLFGSLMVVTGPTVVIPLLATARLRPRVGGILRWEGIIVDPVGAVLGVSILEVLLLDEGTPGAAFLALARITVVGCLVGAVIALLLVAVLDRHLVPDHLRGALSLVAAIGSFAIANALYSEAGLYAVTVAGILLANQRRVPIKPMISLYEHLASLILAAIFVVLAARIDPDTLSSNLLPALVVLLGLVLIVRPAAVAASTFGTSLTIAERAYLAGLAPRGIVAASVSAVFGASLAREGVPGGEDLAAITFLVVCGTVLIYGPLAKPLGAKLKVAIPEPTGVLLVGARRWSRQVGNALSDLDVPVMLLAEDDRRATNARSDGLLVFAGNFEGSDLDDAIKGLGARLAIVGSGAEVLDAAVIDRVVEQVGRSHVFRVARDDDHAEALDAGEAREGKRALAPATQERLSELLDEGAMILALPVDQAVTHRDRPILAVSRDGIPRLVNDDDEARLSPGDRLVVLRLPG